MLPFGAAVIATPLEAVPGNRPAEDERTILFGEPFAWPAFAADILGKPEPVVIALAAIAFGGGTNDEGDGFAGSSYVGAGKTGAALLRPVPDGPPPPALRLGCPPDVPLDALSAWATICCWRARTSLPLVT